MNWKNDATLWSLSKAKILLDNVSKRISMYNFDFAQDDIDHIKKDIGELIEKL